MWNIVFENGEEIAEYGNGDRQPFPVLDTFKKIRLASHFVDLNNDGKFNVNGDEVFSELEINGNVNYLYCPPPYDEIIYDNDASAYANGSNAMNKNVLGYTYIFNFSGKVLHVTTKIETDYETRTVSFKQSIIPSFDLLGKILFFHKKYMPMNINIRAGEHLFINRTIQRL